MVTTIPLHWNCRFYTINNNEINATVGVVVQPDTEDACITEKAEVDWKTYKHN